MSGGVSWTIRNRADRLSVRLAWATAAGGLLVGVALLPAALLCGLWLVLPSVAGWLVGAACAALAAGLAWHLVGAARDPDSHPQRRKHLATLSLALVLALALAPGAAGMSERFGGAAIGPGESGLFLLDNALKVVLLDTLEVFDVTLGPMKPADHLARLYTLVLRLLVGLGLVELGLTLRREARSTIDLQGSEEQVARDLRALVFPSRQLAEPAPLPEPAVVAEEDDQQGGWVPKPGWGLGCGCGTLHLVALVGFAFAARVVGAFGNHVGGFWGFPSAGTKVFLFGFGAFALLMALTSAWNAIGLLFPSGPSDQRMSASNALTGSLGLVWLLGILVMLPGSPFAAGLGHEEPRLLRLLVYLLDNALNAVVLDVPDLWGWNLSGLEPTTPVPRAFAVAFRAVFAWGVVRLVMSSRGGVIGGDLPGGSEPQRPLPATGEHHPGGGSVLPGSDEGSGGEADAGRATPAGVDLAQPRVALEPRPVERHVSEQEGQRREAGAHRGQVEGLRQGHRVVGDEEGDDPQGQTGPQGGEAADSSEGPGGPPTDQSEPVPRRLAPGRGGGGASDDEADEQAGGAPVEPAVVEHPVVEGGPHQGE